jgi:diguanylate cyclase (GGDEF)-like protein/PAS domain S-box-containing protein
VAGPPPSTPTASSPTAPAAALAEQRDRLLEAQRIAQVGDWRYDVVADALTVSAELSAIVGWPRHPNLQQALDCIVPADRALFADAQRLAQAHGSAEVEFRIQRANGEVRTLFGRLRRWPERGLMGTAQDITVRRRLENELGMAHRFNQLTLEAGGMGAWSWDLQTGLTQVNRRWCTLYGIDPVGSVTFDTWYARVHPEDLPGLMVKMKGYLRGYAANEVEYRVRLEDGTVRWLLERGRVTERDAAGEARVVSGVSMDLTERRRAAQAERRAEVILSALTEAVITCDAGGRILEGNQAFEVMTGLSSAQAAGRRVASLVNTRRARIPAAFVAAIERGTRWAGELEVFGQSGDVAVWASCAPLGDERDEQVLILADISALRASEHRADHDLLTGLVNRRALEHRLSASLDRARHSGQTCGVVFLDLDHFKPVNDTYGHAMGDALLVAASERLREAMRPNDLVARYGGDEFVVLLEGCDPDGARRIVERLLAAMAWPFLLGKQSIQVSASAGVAIFPGGGESASALVRHADAAMLRAKNSGRACYAFHDRVGSGSDEAFELEAALRVALNEGTLAVHYQPVVDLQTERCVFFEALARWTLPTRGAIAPAQFIALAEETGQIYRLGQWVIEQVAADIAGWRVAGLQPPPVAINASVLELREPAYVADRLQALKDQGVPAEGILVEVTESRVAQAVAPVIASLNGLRAAGVRIALDDFGAGQSSLLRLRRLPVDVLKVDQAFVRQTELEEGDAFIIRAVVGLARALGVQVVAEGVEHPEQVSMLRELKVDLAQGWFYDRARPANELHDWMIGARDPDVTPPE